MDIQAYLKKIPSEEKSIKQEAAIYQRMNFKERLKCFTQLMALVEHLRPPLTYNDGEPPLQKLWKR